MRPRLALPSVPRPLLVLDAIGNRSQDSRHLGEYLSRIDYLAFVDADAEAATLPPLVYEQQDERCARGVDCGVELVIVAASALEDWCALCCHGSVSAGLDSPAARRNARRFTGS